MKKLTSLILAAALSAMSFNVFAAGKDDLSSSFSLGKAEMPKGAYHQVSGDKYKSVNGGPVAYFETDAVRKTPSGEPLSYSYYQSPVSLANDAFDQAVPYMCYGVSGSTAEAGNDNSMRFDVQLPETAEENNGIYLSFYYRSASKFYGAGTHGETEYTGQTTESRIFYNYKKDWFFQSNCDRVGTMKVTFVPDDKWHRVEMTALLDSSTASDVSDGVLKLAINLPEIYKSAYIEFAGFRAGVLKSPDAINNNRMFTEVSWHLQKANPKSFAVDGNTITLSDGVYEYRADGSVNPQITVQPDKGILYDIEKIKYNKYKVTCYAGGYDPLKTEDETVTFRERYTNGDFSGTVTWPEVKNSQLKTVYYITLDIPIASAKMTVDGKDTNLLDGTSEGSAVEMKISMVNAEEKAYNYKLLLVIRKDGRVLRVIPYTASLSKDETSADKTFTYLIDNEDYSGAEACLYMIDCDTFGDVIRQKGTGI